MDGTNGLAWNLYIELRKEIVATQHLRSRAIEFKITLIGAAFALFVANLDKISDRRLLILPAFAAIFFDFLIASYNFGIKRQSHYLRDHVEKRLRKDFAWPRQVPLWEKHVSEAQQRQVFSIVANLGLSLLAALPGIYELSRPPLTLVDAVVMAMVFVLLLVLARVYGKLGYFTDWSLFGPKRTENAGLSDEREALAEDDNQAGHVRPEDE